MFLIRAARLTPRHAKSTTGAQDFHHPKAVTSLLRDGAHTARPPPLRGRAWLAPHLASPLRDGSRGELGPKPSWSGHLMSRATRGQRRRSRCSHETRRKPTNRRTCPDNGRAASHVRSRKRARFAAPEVPSTSKTPARGAPASPSARESTTDERGCAFAVLTAGRARTCDGEVRTRPAPTPGVNQTWGVLQA